MSDIYARCIQLARELAEAREAANHNAGLWGEACARATAAEAERDALRTENERLKDALIFFRSVRTSFDGYSSDPVELTVHGDTVAIFKPSYDTTAFGDALCRARSALSPNPRSEP